jgi:hypothetical protein
LIVAIPPEIAMRVRLACVVILALFAGCSKSNGPQIATVGADAFEKPKTPEPEEKQDAGLADEREAEVMVRKVEGKLVLPADGGDWPVVASTPVQGLPVPLTQLLPGTLTPHNVAVSPAVGRAIITLWETDFKKKKNGTHLFWCDLKVGKVTHTWDASNHYLGLFDIHANGRQLLLRREDRDRETHVLHLWTIAEDGRLLRKEWEPYYTGHSSDGEPRENDSYHTHRPEADVRWAAFAGDEHIVTVCGNGEMKVWDRESLKQLAVFSGVTGLPALTNDGQQVAFVTGERLALLDPKSLKIAAARHVGKPPDNPVLAFRPDGKRLAIAGTGRAIIVTLEGTTSWDTMLPELRLEYHGLLPQFGWASDRAFYFHWDLYDMPVPIKIWHYGVPHCLTVRGGQVWVVTHALGDKETALRAFKLPHPRAEQVILAAEKRSDLFALRPGDPVRIDVSGVPANRQKEVNDALERRVKEVGYRLDLSAKTVFVASVDTVGKKVSKTYTIGKSQVTGTYNERWARLKIVQNGRVLWETASTDAPGIVIVIPNGVDPVEYISRFGSPAYSVYSKHPLPGVLRASKDAEPLGHSQFFASGIVEWR